jgi:hypothetical protein
MRRENEEHSKAFKAAHNWDATADGGQGRWKRNDGQPIEDD